jgi:transcriptional repressor NrdR
MILVVKKDGRREPFNPEKIRRGLIKACEKRPIAARDMDKIVADVEKKVFNSLDQEVTSTEIGEMVMRKLRERDEVAYVRFASVYREFKDIDTFLAELNGLKGGSGTV